MVTALCRIRTRCARGVVVGGRSADSVSVRWFAVIEPPRHVCVRTCALAGTCGHGPSWAAGTRALPN
jgi:hypothetical protein